MGLVVFCRHSCAHNNACTSAQVLHSLGRLGRVLVDGATPAVLVQVGGCTCTGTADCSLAVALLAILMFLCRCHMHKWSMPSNCPPCVNCTMRPTRPPIPHRLTPPTLPPWLQVSSQVLGGVCSSVVDDILAKTWVQQRTGRHSTGHHWLNAA